MKHDEIKRVFTLKTALLFLTAFALVMAASHWLGLPALALAMFFFGLSLWVAAYRFELPILFLIGGLVYAGTFVCLALGI